jgi:hypothetical protein
MALPAVKAINAFPGGTIAAMAVPLASETVAPSDDLVLHIKTTGTATTITWTDPGSTPSGAVIPAGAASVVQTMAATEERFIWVPQSLASPVTGLIAVAFSGALTGVTGEWLRM